MLAILSDVTVRSRNGVTHLLRPVDHLARIIRTSNQLSRHLFKFKVARRTFLGVLGVVVL